MRYVTTADVGPGYRDAIHDYSERQGYSLREASCKDVAELFHEARAQVAHSLNAGVEAVVAGVPGGKAVARTVSRDADAFFADIGGVDRWRSFLHRKLQVSLQLHP
ncbi:unnamed protein product, partial [Amoebophrya sp. A25]|eukprot:GSA25T00008962001.1